MLVQIDSLRRAVGEDGEVRAAFPGSRTLDVLPRDGLRAKDMSARLRGLGFDCRTRCYEDDATGRLVWFVEVAGRIETTRPHTAFEARILSAAALGAPGEAEADLVHGRPFMSGSPHHTMAHRLGSGGSALTAAMRRLVRCGDLGPEWMC